ncbi:uncharacterized protein AMSG_09512 [Thecamonas trahens ATCC 50062]|uniref:PH domain-containing protein n=1 Tax=Thecamonas trahens ATCC 50062 TaxID=461836 RepID=A0A0L0DNA4_THETB|nr:hypothetical protein AMSG_09512 [Thecamonas trahens ATCC 50062]KNC53792.1 hypothetical protein AMSG_09512 [Thecamonas trahens ATCC 50062]|eukprot:XP_013754353.1 hypothetical protein AMSG_09512 [Thecamonas trahens ATCC 50062]
MSKTSPPALPAVLTTPAGAAAVLATVFLAARTLPLVWALSVALGAALPLVAALHFAALPLYAADYRPLTAAPGPLPGASPEEDAPLPPSGGSLPPSVGAPPTGSRTKVRKRVARATVQPPPRLPVSIRQLAQGAIPQYVTPNTREPVVIDNDFFSGRMIVKMISDPPDPHYAPYFALGKRSFEIQIQGKFKVVPQGTLYMGVESMIRGLHSSFGTRDDSELPHIVFPLTMSVDRYIVTPPGESPPDLCVMMLPGTDDENAARRKNARIDDTFTTTDTYTLSFHSANLDLVQWKAVKIPGLSDLELTSFVADQPLRIVAYTMGHGDFTHRPHLTADKTYLFAFEFAHTGGVVDWSPLRAFDAAAADPNAPDHEYEYAYDDEDGDEDSSDSPLTPDEPAGPSGPVTMAPPPLLTPTMSRGSGERPIQAESPEPPLSVPPVAPPSTVFFEPIRILDMSVPIWAECALGASGQRMVVFLISVLALKLQPEPTDSPHTSTSSRLDLALGGLEPLAAAPGSDDDNGNELSAVAAAPPLPPLSRTRSHSAGSDDDDLPELDDTNSIYTDDHTYSDAGVVSRQYLLPADRPAASSFDAGDLSDDDRPDVELSDSDDDDDAADDSSRTVRFSVLRTLGDFVKLDAACKASFPDHEPLPTRLIRPSSQPQTIEEQRQALSVFLSALVPREAGDSTENELACAFAQQQTLADTLFLSNTKRPELKLRLPAAKGTKGAAPQILHEAPVARSLWETFWREEWAVLTPARLAFYSARSRKPLQTIALGEVMAVTAVDEDDMPFGSLHFFQIETPGRLFYMCMRSQASRDAFVHAVAMACAALVARDAVPAPRLASPATGPAPAPTPDLSRSPSMTIFAEATGDDAPVDSAAAAASLPPRAVGDEVASEDATAPLGWEAAGSPAARDAASTGYVFKAPRKDSKRQRVVLNARKMAFRPLPADGPSALAIVESLLRTVATLRPDSRTEEITSFLDSTADLKLVELTDLDENQRLAFFLNLFHTLLQHALLVMGHPSSALSRKSFYNRASYEVAGYVLSLSEIQHSVLRAGMARPKKIYDFFIPKFGQKRLKLNRNKGYPFALSIRDARVNYAINLGTRSSLPWILVYTPAALDEQLDYVASCHVNAFVELNEAKSAIILPRVCQWYAKDFDHAARSKLAVKYGILRQVARYLDEDPYARLRRLLDAGSECSIKYAPFDWTYWDGLRLVDEQALAPDA